MRSRMANFTNYQEGKATKLMLETQQRTVGSKSADANVDGSVREPPSPIINISGGGGGSGGGGFRCHQLPPSYHHHLESYHYELASHHHLHHLSADVAESPGKKSSSPVEHSSSSTSSGGGLAYETGGLSNPPDAVDDIRKCGYLRKQKHGHKRFFVLRASSHLGPSRLEYYDNEKKFRSTLRGGAGPVGPSSPKRVIYLYQCFTVNKRADSKNKHLIALYTKDEYFAIVAESEQDQEDWYVAISELMNEGRKGHLITDDLDDGYGTVTPGTVFKEVWHVNVKPKGLGQTKNLTGLYRLCLSSKTLHLIKLNSETPCVNQHLMNIRRCGNSESFFFIEVGRFSSIGPGEIWMQVDDSVVAQKMHETLLNTMKALKAYVEVRPRSKSQSSGSNPMPFVTTHRHLSNLPPSQTGLQRRSRLESAVGTPPSSKSSGASGYRFRTSSEGEGTMSRLFRSTTGSLVHLNSGRPHLGRAEGDQAGSGGAATGNAGGGRHVRAAPGSSTSNYHARSASLPVSHPFTTSPVSVSSSSGHGSVSDTLTRPSSASICGSPSDGGFNSSDEYGSSPGDFRYFRVRSNTPDSLGNTPPIREENCLSDYMAVGWNREAFGAGSGNNSGANTPRDESTSTTEDERFFPHRRRRSAGPGVVAVYPKMTQTNFSSEEGADASGGSCSEQGQQNRSSTSLSSTKEDSGYVAMLHGAAPSPRDAPPDYVPMHPGFHPVSHPHQFQSPTLGPRSAKPQPQSSVDTHGYMMMLPGCRGGSPSPARTSRGGSGAASAGGSDGVAERPANAAYMDMSCAGGAGQKSEGSGASHGADAWRSFSPYFSLPRSYKAPTGERDQKECDDYVPMASLAKAVHSSVATASLSTPERGCGCTSTPSHPPPPYGAHHATADGRVARPNRLPLGRRSFHGLPRVSEPSASPALTSTSAPAAGPPPGRPSSPGEYINIDFGDHYPRQQQPPAYALSTNDEAPPTLASGDHRRTPPLPQTSQDYMSMEVGREHRDSAGCLDKSQSPRPSLVAPWNPPSYIRPLASNPAAPASPGVHAGGHWRSAGDDYTNMIYSRKSERTPANPADVLQHLCVLEGCYGHASSSIPPTLPPRSPPHPLEPKVVRADPQGRRRHSSETFSSTSSSTSTPSGGPSSATHLTPADPPPSNGSHAPEVQASRCAGLASFDSAWMSVESRGDPPVDRAPVGSSDPAGVATGAPASPSTPTSRMYGSDASVGYQNGLNYIALEVRDVGSCADATPSTGVAEGSAMPENGAYASLDKSDVPMTTQD
ncbi:insulin receptor substrate 2-A [Hippocampus zosterae]|uniref:insulin receptor substrate 2-A n=1 Tax=Hippocampus zosterae TaxID=109293 RepID=UPI00223D62D2|nr:insulin receptor substrate 2-A [Hippocampus zosterae]